MAACSVNRPGRPPRSASVTRPVPSAMAARSHRDRSCSSSSSSRPSGVRPGGPARVGQQQQREQPAHLRLVRHQLAEHPGQAEGPLHQVGPDQVRAGRGGVAGGVQQVDHGEHGVEPVRQLGGPGHPVRDPGRGDLLLRAGDPRRHGRLGDQERLRDLRGGQAAHQPQRERHLRLPGQRGMAAGEHQPQPVVGDDVIVRCHGFLRLCARRRSPARARSAAAAWTAASGPGAAGPAPAAGPWWSATPPGFRGTPCRDHASSAAT